MELTDLEICKRIAEIDGKTDIESIPSAVYDDSILNNSGLFNPLTDDSLCFQLMVKHRINFETIATSDGEFVCYDFLWPNGQFYKSLQNDNPNRGICIAIIEANK